LIFFARTETTAAPTRTSAGNGYSAAGLTRRELEILRLVAEGHSNAELARTLWVTEQTIKFHLSNIYRKLEVANRTEASRWAQLHGVLEQPDAEPTVV
jgi:DNA-binding CsgD family transcriptional regulator